MAELNTSPGKTRNRVLVIVDDEEEILYSLKSLFKKEYYKTYFFKSAKEAIHFLEKNIADVIISDMRMPEINGIELLQKSIELSPNSIRIILSGYEEKSVILDALSNGLARHYIMKPWEDDNLKEIVNEAMEFQRKSRKSHLMGILNSFNTIPSPPSLHNKLKNMLQNNGQSQKIIVEEIEKSTALVVKLLRIANSVFYGTRIPVSSIQDAIRFIGTDYVLNIVLSLESFESFTENMTNGNTHIIEEIQINSIKRGQIAREIASRWKDKVDLNEAYVAGLLLDIGTVLRYCMPDKRMDAFSKILAAENKSIYNIEKEVFDVTHDEIAEALLTYWNFSPNVISAVANHHNYTNKENLTTIVQIADSIVQGKISGPHDPEIDILVEKWKNQIEDMIVQLNIATN